MALVDSLDAALADMLPRAGDPTSAQRAAEAVRTFSSAVGQLDGFLLQLQELQPAPRGADATQKQDVEDLKAELLEKDRLIAHAKEQIARWQGVIQQQEQLQETTLFAGLGS
ncbi:hypothetical protein HYH02_004936 [Chlamydomonas schloesseri]|uniref:Mediator of RNA polymerase II transcription subunit 28 n=1 Tax=Chlamydomonas schloesseri TaxID=2026947 RepID=A0A835WMC1_9CHLO|nr:hypothetical protein HYH02_004936 [Chlamydomonas schloesseri]|eukprot:KAG2450434.1 hypothetical protein HYH02_004936 [Chlamydomonas schloesseri]